MWIVIHIPEGVTMKTIQITIDEPLLDEVDRLVQAMNTARSAFIREALHLAIKRHGTLLEEQRHARGYALHPVEPGEFDVWTNEQSWGEL